MILALTTEGENVFQHFGQCSSFTMLEIEDGKIKSRKMRNPDAEGHCMNSSFLKASKVGTLICGIIGAGAQKMLKEEGVQVIAGVEGRIDDIVAKFLAGELKPGEGSGSSHHGHKHGHSCNYSLKQ